MDLRSTEYMYGKLNKEILYFEYKGSITNTATTSIIEDNEDAEENRTISVNVLKVPHKLSFKEDENTVVYFDGSEAVDIDLSIYSLDANSLSRVELEDNILYFYDKSGNLITSLSISSFVQEQSNLAETNENSETFVKNKSTKYLTNEGEDGSSPYATVKGLEDVESELQGVDEALRTDLAAEITRAKKVEISLQTSIEEETTRAKNAESTLTTNLNSEITRAKNAESTLQTNLNSEISNRESADASLQNSITTETNNRISADNTLQSNISSEIQAREEADEALKEELNASINECVKYTPQALTEDQQTQARRNINTTNISSVRIIRGYEITVSTSEYQWVNSTQNYIEEDGTTGLTFSVLSEGDELPSTILSVEGATYVWNQSSGILTLSDPTDDVVIVLDWQDPIQTDSTLFIQQIYLYTQSNTVLNIE